MRLRYTGLHPVTFMTAAGELDPGAEFSVPDGEADTYTGRPDIAVIPDTAESEPAARARKSVKTGSDEQPAITDPVIPE